MGEAYLKTWIPVAFGKEHKNRLAHARVVKYQNGMVAIHPRFNKLITVLRTAVENGEGSLDMEALVTTTRMLLMFWR